MLVSGSDLKIGDKFKLTGDACNEAERKETRTFEVVNQCRDDHKGATHLMVKDETGKVEETMIMPWVKVEKL